MTVLMFVTHKVCYFYSGNSWVPILVPVNKKVTPPEGWKSCSFLGIFLPDMQMLSEEELKKLVFKIS